MRNALLVLAILVSGCAAPPPVAQQSPSVEPRDPVAQVATLRTLNDGHHPVNADFRREVAEGLAASDGRAQYYALQAAPQVVTAPEVREQLIVLASSPEAYRAVPALEVLSEPDRFALDDGVAAVFYHALDHAQPAVVLTALDRMGTQAESMAARSGVYDKVVALTRHQNPFIRGRAIELTTRMVAPSQQVALAGTLRNLLRDRSPYVRSKAAEALGEMGDKSSIRAIAPLLDDSSASEVKASYVDLLGETVPMEDQGSTWARVDDAALYALHLLDVFQYGDVDPERMDQDIAREVKRAKQKLK